MVGSARSAIAASTTGAVVAPRPGGIAVQIWHGPEVDAVLAEHVALRPVLVDGAYVPA